MTMRSVSIAVVFVLTAACLAQAGSIALFTENMPATVVAGNTTNIISVNFTDDSTTPALRGQQMLIQLTAGSIYQNENGNELPTAPTAPPQNFVNVFPDLADDSFVTMGGLRSGTSMGVLGVGCAANIAGGCDGVPAAGKFDGEGVAYAWAPGTGVNPPPGNGFITAQITLSNDAEGTWTYFGSTADGTTLVKEGLPIRNGVMIPEPASAALLGLAMIGVVGVVRRRIG